MTSVWHELEAALARAEHLAALEAALALWQRHRDPALADLVDALGGRLRAARATARTKEQQQRAWLARARRPTAAERGSLLATLAASLPLGSHSCLVRDYVRKRHRPLLARLRAIAAWPDDPRVARRLALLIERAPFVVGENAGTVYGPMLELVARLGDERAAEVLERLLARPVARTGEVRAYLAEAIPPAVAASRARAAAAEALAPAERERAAALAGELAPPAAAPSGATEADAGALLAIVLDNPRDDGARAVLGDALIERGDPRGELIALQLKELSGSLAERDRARVRGLIRQHQREWLGELAPVIKSPGFHLGMLDSVELLQHSQAAPEQWERASMAPALATLRVLHKGRASDDLYRKILLSPMLRDLREAEVSSRTLLAAICERAEPWTLERLRLVLPPRGAFETLERARALPALAELAIEAQPAHVERLLRELAPRATLRARLGRIRLRLSRRSPWSEAAHRAAARWIAAAADLHPPPELVFELAGGRLVARAGTAGLVLEAEGAVGYWLGELLAALGSLAASVEQLAVRDDRSR